MHSTPARWHTFTPIAAITLAGTLLAGAGLAPEPDPVPRRWQLDATFGPLRLALVELKDQPPKAFYYLTYKVTNNSGQDLLFAGSFDMSFADGTVLRGGRGVSPEVTKEIIDRTGNPALKDQIGILGTLPQGPENAREGIIIWTASELKPGEIKVYAAGFSGETAIVDSPSAPAKPAAADPKKPDTAPASKEGTEGKTVLRKTKMLRYANVGEFVDQRDKPLELIEDRWIMR